MYVPGSMQVFKYCFNITNLKHTLTLHFNLLIDILIEYTLQEHMVSMVFRILN